MTPGGIAGIYQAGPAWSYFIDSRRHGEAHARARLPGLMQALAPADITTVASQRVVASG